MARCWCRKPAPGMLIESALDLSRRHNEYYPPHLGLMVGDRPEDEQCAKIAGLDFQWGASMTAAAEFRDLYPWEARTGCPKCRAKPGQRCVTTRPLHMPPWNERELRYVGTPTTAHKARYQLWCHLWGRNACTVGAVPSAERTTWAT